MDDNFGYGKAQFPLPQGAFAAISAGPAASAYHSGMLDARRLDDRPERPFRLQGSSR